MKITITSQDIPNWQNPSTVEIRIFLDRAFITSDGVPLQRSSPGNGNCYLKKPCIYNSASRVLTIPSLVLDSTRDGRDSTTARYSAFFFNSQNQQIAPFYGFESFQLPELFDTGLTATWQQIRSFNVAVVPVAIDFETYSRTEIDRKLLDIEQVTYTAQSPIEVSGATIRLLQNQPANSFIASPNSPGNFTVRTITVNDLPTIPAVKLSGLNTDLVAESSRLYFTTDRARNSISATFPLEYSNGVLSIQQASSSRTGFLSSADWNSFNSKANAFTVTTPLSLTAGVLSVQQASSSQNGFLSSTDWNNFNNKANAFTVTAPLSLTAGVLSVQQASSSQSGFLSSTDWNSFNSKVPANRTISAGTGLSGGGDLSANRTLSVTPDSTVQRVEVALNGTLVAGRKRINFTGSGVQSVTDDPVNNEIDIVITGGTGGGSTGVGVRLDGNTISNSDQILNFTDGSATALNASSSGGVTTITLNRSSSTSDGFLSSTDWNSFNNKANAFTVAAPLSLTAGVLSVQQASSSQSGFLSSTDWNSFNNKLSSVTPDSTVQRVEVALNGTLVAGRKRLNFTGSGVQSVADDPVNNEIDVVISPNIASISGTANQVLVENNSGDVRLSLPQNIHALATPSFNSANLSQGINLGALSAISPSSDFRLTVSNQTDKPCLRYVGVGFGTGKWQFSDNGIDFIDLSKAGGGSAEAITSINNDATTAQLIVGSDEVAVSTLNGTTTIRRRLYSSNESYFTIPPYQLPSGLVAVTSGANQIRVYRFYLPIRMSVSRLVAFLQSSPGSTVNISIGIYSADGNTKLLDTGPFSASPVGVRSQAVSAVLAPGYYYMAWTSNSNTFASGLGCIAAMTDNAAIVVNETVIHVGIASNTSTGTAALPPSLGTITASNIPIPFVKLQS